MTFTEALTIELIEAEESGRINEFQDKYTALASEEELKQASEQGFSSDLLEFYQTESNGVEFNWWKDEAKGIGGSLHLNVMKHLLQDQPALADECDMDPEMDQEIRHFRILDTPTMNSEAGFFVLPGQKAGKTVHFRMAGDKWTEDLDLDFKGYLDMAFAARICFNWQLAVIDIKHGKTSQETIDFKENVVAAFPDFNWDDFVKQYQEIRLQNAK